MAENLKDHTAGNILELLYGILVYFLIGLR